MFHSFRVSDSHDEGPGPSRDLVVGFNANDINGLVLWLKADKGVTGTTSVTSWQDQSQAGNTMDTLTARGTQPPALITDEINSLPVIRFGSDLKGLAHLFGPSDNPLDGASGLTIFYIIQHPSIVAQFQYLFSAPESTGAPGFNTVTGSADQWASGIRTTGKVDTSINTFLTPILSNGLPRLMSVQWDGASGVVSHYEGDTLLSHDGGTGYTGTLISSFQEFVVGSFSSDQVGSPFGWAGDLGELILYNTDILSDDRTTVWEYLSDKWGIAL